LISTIFQLSKKYRTKPITMIALRTMNILVKNMQISRAVKLHSWTLERFIHDTSRHSSIQLYQTTIVPFNVVHTNFHTLCHKNEPFHKHGSSQLISARTQVRKAQSEKNTRKDIVEAKDKPYGELSTSQKVKRAGKDASYTAIVIAGIAVTGALFFAIGRELLSGQSPSGVYSRAFKLVKNHDDVIVYLGDSLKGYGETNRRGRRRHVSHQEYERDGVKHMRMKFYVEGDKKGTVHLEAKQDERGKYDFRYVFVEVEDYPRRTIIVQDNR